MLSLAAHSKEEIVSALKTAYDKKQLRALENGNMVFMMSKSAYLFDAPHHRVDTLKTRGV